MHCWCCRCQQRRRRRPTPCLQGQRLSRRGRSAEVPIRLLAYDSNERVIGIETFAHDPLSDPGYHPIESSRAKSAVEDRDECRSLGQAGARRGPASASEPRPGQERRRWRPRRLLAREGGRAVMPACPPSPGISSGGRCGHAAPAPPGKRRYAGKWPYGFRFRDLSAGRQWPCDRLGPPTTISFRLAIGHQLVAGQTAEGRGAQCQAQW
jgi:hypothetical protein